MQSKARLKEEIKSYKKNNKKEVIYGNKGDIVKIMSKHGDVFIVEGKERFSVHKLNLEMLD